MKKKKKKKSFDLMEKEFGANPLEARKQEMTFVLPGFFTVYNGQYIESGRRSNGTKS